MKETIIKKYSLFFAIYLLAAIAFYWIGGEQLHYREQASTEVKASGLTTEFSEGNILRQNFLVTTDTLDKVTFYISTYGRQNKGFLNATLIETSTAKELAHLTIDSSLLENDTYYEWNLDTSIPDAMKKSFTLILSSECPAGEAPAFYYGEKAVQDMGAFTINEVPQDTQLCFRYAGKHFFLFGQYYWVFVLLISIFIILNGLWNIYQNKAGKPTFVLTLLTVWENYEFLINQLVARDFKTKYKRSVLGYLWSFLNPLLTMAVQYIVFSTIFRSDIKNFPVYLLTGIILFNFFAEAVGQGLISIVANASLITKVYVPKYIYPSTKVISCSINLLISIIPLLIVTILTGAKITPAILLMPFVLICLLLFCIGLSLVLSSAMVFFRDTQYLWGIVSLIWTYATPLFYPETIIPPQFQIILKINPMYYFVKFARTLLIDGVSPEPIIYAYCLISAVAALAIGAFVFKKTQDKFVLYI